MSLRLVNADGDEQKKPLLKKHELLEIRISVSSMEGGEEAGLSKVVHAATISRYDKKQEEIFVDIFNNMIEELLEFRKHGRKK